ncbi:alpha/beta hydrolase [Actinophytocola sp. S1-96]|uniref:Alpha/beta hydrolase n=1 Tax=Actinophytocola gossypii TaxID=2812003 RepID=A0ABT2J721_9PSEU|nr:alpha/beta hydrolase [Actinophytocola gossypii]
MSAGYRLLGQDAASIDDCLTDVRRSLHRFTRLAASRGLDASRLAAGGSSAGAHLALVAALTTQAPGVTSLVALNPAGLDLCSLEPAQQRDLEHRIGIAPDRLAEFSLIEQVRPGNPRTLIHHRTHDEIEPIDAVRRFRDAMTRAGNDCTLLEYEHAKHGFHYDSDHARDVLATTTRFLLDESTSPASGNFELL